MTAGRMSIDHDALAKTAPEIKTGLADLRNNVADAHLRAQVIAGDRDGDAMRVEPARHVAEHRRVERAPIAAVYKHRKRRGPAAFGKEQVKILSRTRAIGHAECRAFLHV